MKARTTPCIPLVCVLALLFCLAGNAPLQAQDVGLPAATGTGSLKLLVAGGGGLRGSGPECFARSDGTITAFMAAVQARLIDRRAASGLGALFARIDARGTFIYDTNSWPWPDKVAVDSLSGGASLALSLDFVRPIRLGPRLTAEPFLGAGAFHRDDYQPDGLAVNQLQAGWNVLFTYGIGLGYAILDRIEVQAQLRGSTVSLGTEEIQPRQGSLFEVDAGKITWFGLFAGLAVRL